MVLLSRLVQAVIRAERRETFAAPRALELRPECVRLGELAKCLGVLRGMEDIKASSGTLSPPVAHNHATDTRGGHFWGRVT